MTAVRARRRPTTSARRGPELGLVLRRFPFGESSLVVQVLTPEHGRLSLLAKGAYRPSSGFFAVLDLFDTLELAWNERPAGELGLLTAGAVRVRRAGIAAQVERYRAGLALLELAGLAAREGHEERDLFRWLVQALDCLERGPGDPLLVRVAFDLAFLSAAGLAPALARCAACGQRPAGRGRRVAFAAGAGGRLCPRCEREARASGRAVESLPLNVLRVAESLMAATPAMLEHTRLDPELAERLRLFVDRFLRYHLEDRLAARQGGAAGRGRRRR